MCVCAMLVTGDFATHRAAHLTLDAQHATAHRAHREILIAHLAVFALADATLANALLAHEMSVRAQMQRRVGALAYRAQWRLQLMQ